MDRLRQWRAEHKYWRAAVSNFAHQLHQHTWTDMAREFVELTMPSMMEPAEVA